MMKKIIIISAFLFLLLPVTAQAADNMCNNAAWVTANKPGGCSNNDWIEGWGAARQPENSTATPTQPEWTNASQPEPQVIRLATEGNDINRATNTTDALNGTANDAPVPTTGSVANNDLRITGLPTDVSAQVAAQNQQFVYSNGTAASSTTLTSADFDNRTGVWANLDRFTCGGQKGATSAPCPIPLNGRIDLFACKPEEIKSPQDIRPFPLAGSGPVCIDNKYSSLTASGTSVDCVAEANKLCRFVQVDVYDSTGTLKTAITCYPTSYVNCGATTATVTTYVPPTGRESTPPTTQENPTPPPTAPPVAPQCNQACGGGCPSNLTCVSGVCRNPACTSEAGCTCPGSSFQCQQVKVFRNNVEITPADIQLGDTIVFRGFASAVNTTVSKLRFTLTKAGVAQTPVDVNTVFAGGQYQADYTVNIDTAASYSVTAAPISP